MLMDPNSLSPSGYFKGVTKIIGHFSYHQLIDLTILVSFVLALHSWSLKHYPATFVDEPWLAARTWSYIQTGKNSGPLDQGVMEQFDGYWTFFPLLPTIIQSLALRFSEYPVLFPLRIVSLSFGMLLVYAIYGIGKALMGRQVGLISGLFTAASAPFFISSHLARHDIMAASLGFAAVLLYVKNRSECISFSLLSGLLAGLAFEMHPNGAIYTPAIIFLYLWNIGIGVIRKKSFWGFSFGVIISLFFYTAIHILPYPNTYFSLNKIIFSTTHSPMTVFQMNINAIKTEIIDLGVLLLVSYPITVPMLLWSIAEICKKDRSRFSLEEKTLFILSIGLVVARIMLVRNWLFYYIILFSPVIDMLLAAFLTKIICHQSTWPHIFRYGLVGLALVIMVTSSLSKLPQSWGTSYDTVQSQLNATIQPDESILAAQTYWFGLSDHVYYSWQQLIYYRQQHTESGLQEALESLRPDILIIDDYLDKFISDEPFGTRYMEFLRLSRNEMNVFLYHRAKLVAVIEDKNYGTIRVFRISW